MFSEGYRATAGWLIVSGRTRILIFEGGTHTLQAKSLGPGELFGLHCPIALSWSRTAPRSAARLPGKISRLLASALTDFYRRRAAAPKDAAPAQFHVLQRFASSVNLHLHGHAVISDGVFRLDSDILRFSAPRRPPR